jgi:trehalose/maltose hydrolase-like predicted phosphorylase
MDLITKGSAEFVQIISLKTNTNGLQAQVESDGQPQGAAVNLTFDQQATLADNLQPLSKLCTADTAAIVVENPRHYEASDTIVDAAGQRFDIGLVLMDMLNVPVLSRSALNQAGVHGAVVRKQNYAAWHLDYFGKSQGKRHLGQEAMLTIGNGFIGLRGAYVESHADGDNYPGMYVAGVYNQTTTPVAGRDVTNEDLVNMPNAQYLSFSVDDGPTFAADQQAVRDVYRSLDLRTGQLTSSMVVQLADGRQLRVRSFKAADMQQWHRFAIRYELTPLNFAGELTVHAGIDGQVVNANVDRYKQFDQHHIEQLQFSATDNLGLVQGQTRSSHVQFAIGSKLTQTGSDLRHTVVNQINDDQLDQQVHLDAQQGVPYTFEKSVAVYTSLETPTQPLADMVRRDLMRCSYNVAFSHSADYFRNVWAECDIKIDGDMNSQKLSRVNMFHLMVSSHALGSGKIDASVGARGLHGEAYRGHVFWDEMFILPFLSTHYPRLVREMLKYRYRRLPAAREAAQAAGKRGSMFPWQSGMHGDEQAQLVHLNPLTQQWDPDNSHLQRHVSLAVAYNVWYYCHVAGDQKFMDDYGLEILLATAQFWLSMCTQDDDGSFHIRGVMGPDEFHEAYPGSDKLGLDDNAYTNIMVAWLFKTLKQEIKAAKPLTVSRLDDKLGIGGSDFKQMATIDEHLSLPMQDGIIGQFAGYFDLDRINLTHYRKQYGDVARIDRILKAEGRTPDSYQVAKQADALMAFFILSRRDVSALIKHLGYSFKPTDVAANIKFYLERTTHGSTLSRVVYADLCARNGDAKMSWRLFQEALASDYIDIQGGTTAEGIHLGVMAATLTIITRVYGGFDARGDMVTIRPQLPKQWQKLSFRQRVRGVGYQIVVTPSEVEIRADHDVTVMMGGKEVELIAGARKVVPILY